ncbi:hypothetical protein V6N13_106093 [Hibiscus sabdariffa]
MAAQLQQLLPLRVEELNHLCTYKYGGYCDQQDSALATVGLSLNVILDLKLTLLPDPMIANPTVQPAMDKYNNRSQQQIQYIVPWMTNENDQPGSFSQYKPQCQLCGKCAFKATTIIIGIQRPKRQLPYSCSRIQSLNEGLHPFVGLNCQVK